MFGAAKLSTKMIGLAACLAAVVAIAGPAQSWHAPDGRSLFAPAARAMPGGQLPGTRAMPGAQLPAEYRRQVVVIRTNEKPGTIIVDTRNYFLYYVLPEGRALRYGVGVGREGFGWSGTVTVGRKAQWPTWTPPASMIRRQPHLARYAAGMPGGPDNPLGARALYLHRGGKDTLFRIHGTNEPWSIGRSDSSGCIRMLNEDVIDLYERVRIGAKVIVL